MNLHQPLHVLPGVGPKSAEKYAKLGIENLQDLLLYFPKRNRLRFRLQKLRKNHHSFWVVSHLVPLV